MQLGIIYQFDSFYYLTADLHSLTGLVAESGVKRLDGNSETLTELRGVTTGLVEAYERDVKARRLSVAKREARNEQQQRLRCKQGDNRNRINKYE